MERNFTEVRAYKAVLTEGVQSMSLLQSFKKQTRNTQYGLLLCQHVSKITIVVF